MTQTSLSRNVISITHSIFLVTIETTTAVILEFIMKQTALFENLICKTQGYMSGYHRNHYCSHSRVCNETDGCIGKLNFHKVYHRQGTLPLFG